MIRYIDEYRRSFGVEPICRELQVAPSSYYAARSRPPSARSVSDATLADVIGRVHRANFGVYGIRKVWKTLRRQGVDAGDNGPAGPEDFSSCTSMRAVISFSTSPPLETRNR